MHLLGLLHSTGKYDNLWDASVKILTKEGGFKTFVNGFQPEFLGSAVYGFFSFGGTEVLRRTLAQARKLSICLIMLCVRRAVPEL